ncbi:adaptin ear-binding coat-associated protein 1/2 [Marchantia polymorpha subsp. ruderalis]
MGRDDLKVSEALPSPSDGELEEEESAELVLFQVKECYVYLIPPRKSAASYRADEWDINKWNWEGALRVVSKGEECFIKLEDKSTGELYAQAIVRQDQPLPLEAVIDSSRFFVLRIEDTSNSKQKRHAFIGLGLRERPQAYDFQAAIFDHVKYLNKKKEAEEMEQEYQTKPSVDYSLKEGETLRLQIKTPNKTSPGGSLKAGKIMDLSSLQETLPEATLMRQVSAGSAVPILVPPPPPPPSPLSGGLSPAIPGTPSPASSDIVGKNIVSQTAVIDGPDEDFGDFQAA